MSVKNAFRLTGRVLGKLVEAAEEVAKQDPDHFAGDVLDLLQDKRMCREVVQFLLKSVRSVLPVTVDYSMTLDQMVAAGTYDKVEDDEGEEEIQKHFPVEKKKGKSRLLVRTVFMPRRSYLSSKIDMVRYLDHQGLRAATIAELLAFGAQYPDEQRKYKILALGSLWDAGDPVGDIVPCLAGDTSKRYLTTHGISYGLPKGPVRLLAVRK